LKENDSARHHRLFFVSRKALDPEYVHDWNTTIHPSLRILWERSFRLGRSQREADPQRQSGRRTFILGPSSPNTTLPVCISVPLVAATASLEFLIFYHREKKAPSQKIICAWLLVPVPSSGFTVENANPVRARSSTPSTDYLPRLAQRSLNLLITSEKELTRIRTFKKTGTCFLWTQQLYEGSTKSSAT